ncbi:MAG: FAD-binding oxidoreductase [Proteobacteria bacterium]|nr:FAD-binding oxidoreductase [Pseudomonadota bacterium]MBU6426263.1 FAD-binding oxidoreductase [Rhodospirillales bacterium]
MGPEVDNVETEFTAFPAQADVVVIGGGIIGVCTAWNLAQKGAKVVLCEKGRIAAEQSSRNWGWVRVQGRDVRELPLMFESRKLWARMNELTGAETGYRVCGIAYLNANAKEQHQRAAWAAKAVPLGAGSRVLDSTETALLLPEAARRFVGALFTESDARAEPQLAVPAMARAAQATGVAILQNCAVTGLVREAGKIIAVETERGRIACPKVVLAGGAWSRLFCRKHGIALPQLKVRSSVLRTAPLHGPEISASARHYAFRKRLDGGYTIANGWISSPEITPDVFRLFFKFLPEFLSERDYLRPHVSGQFLQEWRQERDYLSGGNAPFTQERILDPAPQIRGLRQAMRHLARDVPVFADAKVAQSWAGFIDGTPDAIPVISEVKSQKGFYIATGFSGHGFGIGPGAGRLMAEIVAGETPVVDPSAFRMERF